MRVQDFSDQNLNRIIAEINYDINMLYLVPHVYTRNLILNHLRDSMFKLESSMKAMNQPQNLQPQPESGNQITFSLQELARNNGKDGNPAYVVVNGIVYDVTNNAAWAAATHFGMTAGKDLTSEFASCHAGQPILSKLKIVGKLK